MTENDEPTELNIDLVNEIRAAFCKAYKSSLRQAVERGENIFDDDTIDGAALNAADQDADSFVKQNYSWRRLSAEIEAALAQPDCYDSIDYSALQTELRAVFAKTRELEKETLA